MAKTEEHILDTAIEIFWRDGYNKTSIDTIINAAGISKGSLFHYFKNKEELGIATLKRYYENYIFLPLQKLFEKYPQEPIKVFEQYTDMIYSEYINMNLKQGCLFGNFALELTDLSENFAEELKHLYDGFIFLVSTNLISKHPTKKVEAERISKMYFDLVQGVTMSVKIHKNQEQAQTQFEAIKQIIHNQLDTLL